MKCNLSMSLVLNVEYEFFSYSFVSFAGGDIALGDQSSSCSPFIGFFFQMLVHLLLDFFWTCCLFSVYWMLSKCGAGGGLLLSIWKRREFRFGDVESSEKTTLDLKSLQIQFLSWKSQYWPGIDI